MRGWCWTVGCRAFVEISRLYRRWTCDCWRRVINIVTCITKTRAERRLRRPEWAIFGLSERFLLGCRLDFTWNNLARMWIADFSRRAAGHEIFIVLCVSHSGSVYQRTPWFLEFGIEYESTRRFGRSTWWCVSYMTRTCARGYSITALMQSVTTFVRNADTPSDVVFRRADWQSDSPTDRPGGLSARLNKTRTVRDILYELCKFPVSQMSRPTCKCKWILTWKTSWMNLMHMHREKMS